jgi:plastocyanin
MRIPNSTDQGQLCRLLLLLTFLSLASIVATHVGAEVLTSSVETDPPAATTYTVEIKQLKYLPDVLVVHPGDKVQWNNLDIVPHTVTADKAFDSGSIAVGGTWTLEVPSKKGDYLYTCTFHPNMKAKLVVQ